MNTCNQNSSKNNHNQIKEEKFYINNPEKLVKVGFASQPAEPTDQEIYDMIDDAIFQVLGPKGLSAIIKPGYKVVIKVATYGIVYGLRGEKGRGCVPDARIVRYVAEKVREIIGTGGTADLKVVADLFYEDKNPSLKYEPMSFYWARLPRSGSNAVEEGDICYDRDADGYLDGESHAKLVNLDALKEEDRKIYKVKVKNSDDITVAFPKFLRTKEEAKGSHEYCDVFIGIPIMKSLSVVGMTGALKYHYGLRNYYGIGDDKGRINHDGYRFNEADGGIDVQHLLNYLVAQHLVRTYDFVIMDCLTGNRSSSGGNTGSLSRLGIGYEQLDFPVDYILINSILASKDSVAIDTVEAILAGYDPDTIRLLETAKINGVGSNDTKLITVGKDDRFGGHRKDLYAMYPRDKYPFPDGQGDTTILNDYTKNYNIMFSGKPEYINPGKYSIKFNITNFNNIREQIVRVELLVNNKVVDFIIDTDLSQGEFILDYEKLGIKKGTYFRVMLRSWDRVFYVVATGQWDMTLEAK